MRIPIEKKIMGHGRYEANSRYEQHRKLKDADVIIIIIRIHVNSDEYS